MSIRPALVAGFVLIASLSGAAAAENGDSVKGMLGNASDAALDKLSKPGAFSADSAIRIVLPGQADKLGGLMKLTDKAGLTNDIAGNLNHAAEQAAGEAKPIFRSAIDKASMGDAIGIARSGDTAATDYLKKSSNDEITARLLPLVKAALERSGVMKQGAMLSSIGWDEARLTRYVTDKTSDGIFTYVGREETKMRQDPLGSGKALLKGLKF